MALVVRYDVTRKIWESSPDGATWTDLAENFPLGIGLGLTVNPSGIIHGIKDGNSDTYFDSQGTAVNINEYGRKARGTNAAKTTVAAADVIRKKIAQAYDGGAYRSVTEIEERVEAYTGSDNVAGSLIFRARPSGAAAALVDVLKITATGADLLGVALGSLKVGSWFKSATTAGIGDYDWDTEVYNSGAAYFVRQTSNTEIKLPIAGIYFVITSCRSVSGGAGLFQIMLKLNGTNLALGEWTGTAGSAGTGVAMAIINAAANDLIKVSSVTGARTGGATRNTCLTIIKVA